MSMNTAEVTEDGQIKIPTAIRNKLGLHAGSKVYFHEVNGKIVISSLPTDDEWIALTKDIPHERVVFDQHGHYDAKQSPKFDEWMHEDE